MEILADSYKWWITTTVTYFAFPLTLLCRSIEFKPKRIRSQSMLFAVTFAYCADFKESSSSFIAVETEIE